MQDTTPTTPTLRPATFDEWMAALDQYPKTAGCLHAYQGGYCCLGVLAEIEGVAWISVDDDSALGVAFDEEGNESDEDSPQTAKWTGADGGDLPAFLHSRSQRGPLVVDELIKTNDSANNFEPVKAKARELWAQYQAARQ